MQSGVVPRRVALSPGWMLRYNSDPDSPPEGDQPVDLSNELQTAKTIARMAASICQSIQEEMILSAEKPGREPVTIADYASQALIGHALSENFPDDAVLSEERSEEYMLLLSDEQRGWVHRYMMDALGGYVFEEQVCAWLDFGKRKQRSRMWVIDPIDGTTGFMGGRHYCVAIGLLIDFEPVLGVLASPGFYGEMDDPPYGDTGALTAAARGAGVTIEPLFGGEPEPVRVSTVDDPRVATILTSYESSHVDLDFINAMAQGLDRGPDAPRRRLDSQDKHAMLAAGMGDVYVRTNHKSGYREKMWDQAAGTAIVTEAGGRVTDIDGRPLDFSTGTTMTANRGVLMTNGLLHDAVLDAIKRLEP